MTAITMDVAMKVEDDAKPKLKTGDRLDLALSMHLAASRFCSPAGTAFLPQNYLPFLTRSQGSDS
jgi:hypothetical protein